MKLQRKRYKRKVYKIQICSRKNLKSTFKKFKTDSNDSERSSSVKQLKKLAPINEKFVTSLSFKLLVLKIRIPIRTQDLHFLPTESY